MFNARRFFASNKSLAGAPSGGRQIRILGYLLTAGLTAAAALPASAADDSQVVSHTLPSSLDCGESLQVQITLKNTGTTTWTAAESYKLGPVDDQDDLYSAGRIPLPAGVAVAPNQTHTFELTLTAPEASGSHLTDWRMIHVGSGWFGATAARTVTVSCTNDATLVAANLPSSLDCFESYQASVTMLNTGGTTWTRAASYKLGPVDDQDPFHGGGRIELPSGVSVAPGQSHTFPFTLTAGGTEGSFVTDWRMIQPGSGWFGEIASQSVTVACVEMPSYNLLRIHPTNPRYLTDDSGEAIVLAGSHTWAVFQDYRNGVPNGPDPVFNYDGTQGVGGFQNSWLDKLQDWNHNFFRGWHFEDGYYEPWPYQGEDSAGNACNPVVQNFSGCKFNLDKINQDYLDQIRERVRSAADRGIYTSVMLFEGWSVDRKNGLRSPNPWLVHPYKVGNHWPLSPELDDDHDADSNTGLEMHEYPSHDPRIIDKQKAYIRAVVNELRKDEIAWNNVIWQITNESHENSQGWQFHLAGILQDYELGLPGAAGRRHLVWTDCYGAGSPFHPSNPADLVSPCGRVDQVDNGYSTKPSKTNPPAATASNPIVVNDSDHTSPPNINRPWVWKSFLRGLHPVVMDAYPVTLTWFPGPIQPDNPGLVPARQAMGGIQVVAQATDLAALVPQNKGTTTPSSNGYSLHRPDRSEVLAYHHQAEQTVSVCTLLSGRAYSHRELVLTGSAYTLVDRPDETVDQNDCVHLSRGNDEDTVHWLELLPNTPPVAIIGAPGDGSFHATGDSISFDGSGSFDPEGSAVTCSWQFGDGNGDIGCQASHAYASTGSPTTPTVTLTVNDGAINSMTTIQLQIGDGPSITQQPDDLLASLAGDAVFSVAADGDGSLVYQWQVWSGGAWVDLGDGPETIGTATPVLTLGSVTLDDQRDYRCLVSNEYKAAVESLPATLTVGGSMAIRDTFVFTNSFLDGRSTEVGGGVWEANSKIMVRMTNEVSTRNSDPGGRGLGGVPFDPLGLVSRLEADVVADGADVVTVGFSRSATVPYTTDGQLWVRLKTETGSPFYRVRVNGNQELAVASIPGYQAGEPDHVEIEYDPLVNTLEVWINDVAIPLGGQTVAGPFELDFTPDVRYAGIDIQNGTQAETSIDNFEVTRAHAMARDAFTSSAPGDTPLDGWQSGAGERIWAATANLFVQPSGEVSSSGATNEIGGVPFDPAAANELVTLSADIIPRDSYFTAIGFSDSATGRLNADGQLWMFLRITTGGLPKYWIRADGNTHLISDGPIPGYVEDLFNHVELDYDPLTTGYALRVNGVEVETGNLAADIGFVPAIQYAAVHFKEGTLGVSRLDNFEIKRSPTAVRDVFTNGGAGATALDGRQTGAGGRTWAATANLVVRPEDDVSSLGGLSEVGSVPFDPTKTNDVVTLSADVNPRDSIWTALGYSKSATGVLHGNGQLWTLLKITASGAPKYWVRADGNNHLISSGTIPGFVIDQPNRVELTFDPLTTDYELRINGVQVETGNLDADTDGFVPDIQFVGMHLRDGTHNLTRVDNFELRID